jgi:DNA-binding CsgD family transcriptional regulator
MRMVVAAGTQPNIDLLRGLRTVVIDGGDMVAQAIHHFLASLGVQIFAWDTHVFDGSRIAVPPNYVDVIIVDESSAFRPVLDALPATWSAVPVIMLCDADVDGHEDNGCYEDGGKGSGEGGGNGDDSGHPAKGVNVMLHKTQPLATLTNALESFVDRVDRQYNGTHSPTAFRSTENTNTAHIRAVPGDAKQSSAANYVSLSNTSNQISLSERQRKVLAGIARGLNVREIGRELDISFKTVNNCLTTIYSKLGVHNRVEAILVASRLGLIEIGYRSA